MIKQTFDSNLFMNICEKLKEVKDCKLSANRLYAYMVSDNTFTYISDDKEMNGCLVLKQFYDNEGNKALLMIFIWIDPHYPRLIKDFIKLADDKAREIKAVKIYFVANRNEKAIERRTGFKKAFSTFVKDVM